VTWAELNNVAALLQIGGLVVSVVTLLRVQSVRRTQTEERTLLRKLYGTEKLSMQLRSAASYLRKSEEGDARILAEELVRICGEIEGVSRALDLSRRGKRVTHATREIELVERGYYTPAFLNAAVNDAQHSVYFLIYRNLQFTNVDLLESMGHAARRGVHIRILSLSSAAHDSVLEQASLVLPWPKADPATLRRQLRECEERISGIVSGWSPQARSRFEYRGYDMAPGVHFVRVDGVIKSGFIGTVSGAQPERLDDRGYIELPLAREPGATLLRHFDEVWQTSKELTAPESQSSSAS
jgi:hypothetical protein